MTRNRLWRAGLVPITMLLAGCPQSYGIELGPTGSPGSPNFQFTSGLFGNGGAAISGIEVRRCQNNGGDSGEVVWAVSYPGRATVKAFRYGRAPQGFTTVTGPIKLGAGCYIVMDPLDRQALRFLVNSNGQAENEHD